MKNALKMHYVIVQMHTFPTGLGVKQKNAVMINNDRTNLFFDPKNDISRRNAKKRKIANC